MTSLSLSDIQQHIIRKKRMQQESQFNPWRTESRDQYQVYVQAQPFEENTRGSLARPDTSDVPRLAWNVSGVEAIEDAIEPEPVPAPASEIQHVQSRTSVTSSREPRRRKKMSATKALGSSRYLSNTTVCAIDKKTNTKKPFHLYGWGNTRPVGKTTFLGSDYMKSKNAAAKSLSPPVFLAETGRSRREDKIEAIIDETENYVQPSVFGPTTVGSMIHRKHKRPRLNMLENSLDPSFSSGTRRPVPPGAPTRTAQRAFARKTKKQNAVIDSMVQKWEPKGFRIDCNPQNYSHLPRTWIDTIPVAGTTIPVSKRDSVASLLLQV